MHKKSVIFIEKLQKSPSAGKNHPFAPNIRRLGALTPRSPSSGGQLPSESRPPPTPHCEFPATPLVSGPLSQACSPPG